MSASDAPIAGETPDPHVVVRRRPVHDHTGRVFAYLLDLPACDGPSPSDLLLRVLLDVGVRTMTCGTRALIPLSRAALREIAAALPPCDRTILEVDLETWGACAEEIETSQRLGYTWCIRLEAGETVPEDSPDLVRVELASATPELAADCDQAKVGAIVSGVDDRDCARAAGRAGFRYFAGAFWRTPEEVESARISPGRETLLRVMQVVYDKSSSMRDVETVIRGDPGLVHRLMRVLGTAATGLRRPVTSLRQGLVFLGMRTIANWTTLMLLESLSDKPEALVTAAIVRARICELLAHRGGDEAFTVGLLSYFDAFLDMPLADALAELPLAPTLVDAVLVRSGSLGGLLAAAEHLESGETPRGMRDEDAARITREAMAWADELRSHTN